ncbi:hypothetical protein [Helicobacter rodentium]|uniref:hypothetical protein n=1 Tax=Helicobacter rodentium TaxID=59617 RepID=UPI002557CC06|nr:hypothetical protein [Helicobacter rodentium]
MDCFTSFAMTQWFAFCHCEKSFSFSWLSIILHFFKDSIAKIKFNNGILKV